MKTVTRAKFSGLLIGLVLLASMLSAQSLTTGEIAGVVKDPTGAVIQNASLTLKSLDTGATHDAKSGASGEYRFSLLKTGHYAVTVSQPGFQKLEQSVEVTVGSVVTLDLTLTVGQSTQTVEVTGEAPLVNTEQIGRAHV